MENKEFKEFKEFIELLRRDIDKLRMDNFEIKSQLDRIENNEKENRIKTKEL